MEDVKGFVDLLAAKEADGQEDTVEDKERLVDALGRRLRNWERAVERAGLHQYVLLVLS